jgi:hypothetical protein
MATKEEKNSIKEIWVARDKDGTLTAYRGKPVRTEEYFMPNENCKVIIDFDAENSDDYTWAELPSNFYPEITWENSPKKLVIDTKD